MRAMGAEICDLPLLIPKSRKEIAVPRTGTQSKELKIRVQVPRFVDQKLPNTFNLRESRNNVSYSRFLLLLSSLGRSRK